MFFRENISKLKKKDNFSEKSIKNKKNTAINIIIPMYIIISI